MFVRGNVNAFVANVEEKQADLRAYVMQLPNDFIMLRTPRFL